MFKHHDDEKPAREDAEKKTAERKTIEAWGEQKDMWPQFPASGGPANPNAWKFAAAKAHAGWADNQEVTEAEFDKAVEDGTGTTQR